ncbi:hypothetical protein V6N13_054172 [Hibiscus sabdariffa]|uniref:Uncharacterized protein n=1 Tax=Hibiscus sabdariffa TaxID=183260 RepID=A0ABR2DZ61_9ROSI
MKEVALKGKGIIGSKGHNATTDDVLLPRISAVRVSVEAKHHLVVVSVVFVVPLSVEIKNVGDVSRVNVQALWV